ncbi:Uncharacterised protein [Vibrio cholerae]|uniref:Uncharacterized protein n=1 Tax=Vibrio cholerae TaxID=666 RepID=A0A655X7M4_VIBCL|nr:Uncharacterised protein [Vibrio cholerae]
MGIIDPLLFIEQITELKFTIFRQTSFKFERA